MSDDPRDTSGQPTPPPATPDAAETAGATATDAAAAAAAASGLADFVRRAVSASVGVASKSKDDIMRAAGTEIRSWLEHLNLNEELAKALARLVIEVKTEIRFRPNDDGKLIPETTNDVKVKGPRS